MYIFNSFYLLHSYNPSFLIYVCFNMASRPPLSYAESPPGIKHNNGPKIDACRTPQLIKWSLDTQVPSTHC